MIIARTPFRISLFGGGSDYPEWFMEHQGAVLGTTIDKYNYISVRYLPPSFTHKSRVVYSKEECVNDNTEIKHPAIRECLKYLNIIRGIEICHQSDLFSHRGMGTSSAFVVGLLNALYALQGFSLIKKGLATRAIKIEREWIKENVGCQDQYHCAYGGFNHIVFDKNEITVTPIDGSKLEEYMLLFDTGTSRIASKYAGNIIEQIPSKKKLLNKMVDCVEKAIKLISKGEVEEIGDLLDKNWELKKQLANGTSTPEIDEIYEKAKKAGALGGKLLGAGGGGYMLIFAHPSTHKALYKALSHLITIPFKFENTGSQIIFNDEHILKERSGWGEEQIRR